MADHWRTPHTDEDSEVHVFEEWKPGTGRWVEDPREISRDAMFFICGALIGALIGFGMGMVVS